MSRSSIQIEITPDLTDEQADVLGVMSFSYVMQERLIETREKGKVDEKYKGWHRNDCLPKKQHNQFLKTWLQKCIDENKYVDA